jgi:hypothetical protein
MAEWCSCGGATYVKTVYEDNWVYDFTQKKNVNIPIKYFATICFSCGTVIRKERAY